MWDWCSQLLYSLFYIGSILGTGVIIGIFTSFYSILHYNTLFKGQLLVISIENLWGGIKSKITGRPFTPTSMEHFAKASSNIFQQPGGLGDVFQQVLKMFVPPNNTTNNTTNNMTNTLSASSNNPLAGAPSEINFQDFFKNILPKQPEPQSRPGFRKKRTVKPPPPNLVN